MDITDNNIIFYQAPGEASVIYIIDYFGVMKLDSLGRVIYGDAIHITSASELIKETVAAHGITERFPRNLYDCCYIQAQMVLDLMYECGVSHRFIEKCSADIESYFKGNNMNCLDYLVHAINAYLQGC